MKTPRFLKTKILSTPNKPSTAKSASSLGGRPTILSRVLPFVMHPQEQTNWCWAATSHSVYDYLNTVAKWTQCGIANVCLRLNNCCMPAAASTSCNKPWYLDNALTVVGVLRLMTGQDEPFASAATEIDGGLPVCLRVGWRGGGGHFLAIHGYLVDAQGVQYLYVDDPIYGKSVVPYGIFRKSYRGSGAWTHTYFILHPAAQGRTDDAAGGMILNPYPEAWGA